MASRTSRGLKIMSKELGYNKSVLQKDEAKIQTKTGYNSFINPEYLSSGLSPRFLLGGTIFGKYNPQYRCFMKEAAGMEHAFDVGKI